MGPEITDEWNLKIGNLAATEVNSSQQYYALIFQAARDYYYGDRFGLHIPPENGVLKPQIKIAAKLEDGISRANVAYRYGELAALPVGGIISAVTLGLVLDQLPSINFTEYGRNSDRVYAVTAHELAHWAHWNMDKSAFIQLGVDAYNLGYLLGVHNQAEAVIESWAMGVEWRFAMARYRDKFGDTVYEYEDVQDNPNFQRQTIEEFPAYTSIVVDMIDDHNQIIEETAGWDGILPNDRVSGYSILEVQQGLQGTRSWHEWRDNMKNITNPTSGNIDELFGNWY